MQILIAEFHASLLLFIRTRLVVPCSKVVIDYQGCDHDSVYEGMCVVCCKSVEVTTRSHVNMTHDAMSLAVSRPVGCSHVYCVVELF